MPRLGTMHVYRCSDTLCVWVLCHAQGHNWWWSRESGGSLETVRHAPLSRTMALRPGHSHSHYQRTLRSHLLNHQTSLPSWLRGMHDPSLSPGGQHPSHRPGGKAQVVRHHHSPDPLLFPCKGSLGNSNSNHPSCNLAPCVDTSVPQLLHHCNHSVVHPYLSHSVGNTTSAFQPPILDGSSYPGHPQDMKCRLCYPTAISTDAYTPTLAAAGFSSCNTASLNQGNRPSSSLRGRWQKRRHSLPEPLPSSVHNSDMLCSPPPSSPLSPSFSPLPITSELPFLPQSSREVHHTVNGSCARGGKTVENDASTQCQVHSLPSVSYGLLVSSVCLSNPFFSFVSSNDYYRSCFSVDVIKGKRREEGKWRYEYEYG